jgi:cytochrome P450
MWYGASDGFDSGIYLLQGATVEFPGPGFMARPYPTLAGWRRTSPIIWIDVHHAWCLTRYGEVRDALLDDKRLSNDVMRRDTRNASRADHEFRYLWSCLGIWRTLIGPPEHTGLRGIMNKTFLPMLAPRWPRLQNIPFVRGFTKNQAKIFEVSMRASMRSYRPISRQSPKAA